MSVDSSGVGLDVVDRRRSQLSLAHLFGVGHLVGEGGDGPLLGLLGVGGQRLVASRAVTMVGGDGFLTVPTRSALRFGLFVAVPDTDVREDVSVVFVAGDVLVDRPHVGVDLPVDAMLDLRAAEPLADHARNRRVTEVVGVDGLLDTGVFGGLPQLFADVRRGEGTVLLAGEVAVPRDLVKERRVGVLGERMDLDDVRTERRLRVDDGVVGDGRPLQPARVRVRAIGRTLTLEVDVADAERPEQGEAGAGVGEELDDSNVAHVVRAVDEGVDVVGAEHVLRFDAVVGGLGQLVVVGPAGPVDVDLAEELADDELAVPDSPVGEAGLGALTVLGRPAEVEDVLVHVVLGKADDGLVVVETPGRRPEVLEVFGECPLSNSAVESLGESFDVRPVVGVVAVDLVELALALVPEGLEVLQISHNHELMTEYYETQVRKNNLFGRNRFLRIARNQECETGAEADLSASTPGFEPATDGSAGRSGGVPA